MILCLWIKLLSLPVHKTLKKWLKYDVSTYKKLSFARDHNNMSYLGAYAVTYILNFLAFFSILAFYDANLHTIWPESLIGSIYLGLLAKDI